jgi:glycosyltransferase involved in cell wall biosynthesis
MKILHVIASLAPRYGGSSKACMDMAAAVGSRGHDVDVFTTDQDGSGRLGVPLDRPVKVQGVELSYFQSTIRRFWPASIALWRALALCVRNYDLVHIHSLYLFHGLGAARFSRKHGVPYVISPHGALDPYIYARHRYRKLAYELMVERRNLRDAAAVHFTSDEERRLSSRYTKGIASFVVPLGIEPAAYEGLPAPGSFRTAYPEIGNRQIILHLGRLNFKKGLDILVGALALVARARDDVHLVLAGPDNEGYGARVRRWITERGLEDRTTLTGMLQGQVKLAALRDAAVFALPSYSENFGIAIVEAMACGLPVVISNKVNIWQEIESAGAGLVTPCDVAAHANALLKILGDPGLGHSMGARGRALVARQFTRKHVGEQLEAAYQGIVSKGTVNAQPTEPSPVL